MGRLLVCWPIRCCSHRYLGRMASSVKARDRLVAVVSLSDRSRRDWLLGGCWSCFWKCQSRWKLDKVSRLSLHNESDIYIWLLPLFAASLDGQTVNASRQIQPPDPELQCYGRGEENGRCSSKRPGRRVGKPTRISLHFPSTLNFGQSRPVALQNHRPQEVEKERARQPAS